LITTFVLPQYLIFLSDLALAIRQQYLSGVLPQATTFIHLTFARIRPIASIALLVPFLLGKLMILSDAMGNPVISRQY
jgi:hypothetical protein